MSSRRRSLEAKNGFAVGRGEAKCPVSNVIWILGAHDVMTHDFSELMIFAKT